MHIGLDLDNTIIDYNRAFPAVAESLGLLQADHGLIDKAAVKANLMASEGGMERWMRLQGQVYGPCLSQARSFDGLDDFLAHASSHGYRVSVVSHKTEAGHFDETRTHLWDAARDWLRTAGLLGGSGHPIREDDVFFETTRAAKIRRIGTIGCDVFVDDLVEVLADAAFPRHVARVWFTGASNSMSTPHAIAGLTRVDHWCDMAMVVDSMQKAT